MALTGGEEFSVGTTGDTATATHAAAAVTYGAATGGQRHAVERIDYSYSGGTPAGGLKIEDGTGNTIFQIDIVAAGPGFVQFPRPKAGTANTALIITLADGGSGIVGKVSVSHYGLVR